jgi:hypothetical protein
MYHVNAGTEKTPHMSKSITLPEDPVKRLGELSRLKSIAEHEQQRVELGQQMLQVELEIRRAELTVFDEVLAELHAQEQKEAAEFERKTRATLYKARQVLAEAQVASDAAERAHQMSVTRKQTEYLERVLQQKREYKGTGAAVDMVAVDRHLDRIARGVDDQPDYWR